MIQPAWAARSEHVDSWARQLLRSMFDAAVKSAVATAEAPAPMAIAASHCRPLKRFRVGSAASSQGSVTTTRMTCSAKTTTVEGKSRASCRRNSAQPDP